jgi:hypothetical protein
LNKYSASYKEENLIIINTKKYLYNLYWVRKVTVKRALSCRHTSYSSNVSVRVQPAARNERPKSHTESHCWSSCTSHTQRLRWSRGCVLTSITQVRGFKPARSCRIFQGEKIPSTPSFGGEVKPAGPCRRFAACKTSLNATWKSAFRQNSLLLTLAH